MLCDSVAGRLRAQGLYCGAVAVGLKDPGFRTVSRQKHLGRSTHLRGELLEAAMELIDKIWKPSVPVRLLSVTALALTDAVETYEQTDLFTPQQPVENARRERLELAVDGIRQKYGGGAISYGEAADHLTHGEEA